MAKRASSKPTPKQTAPASTQEAESSSVASNVVNAQAAQQPSASSSAPVQDDTPENRIFEALLGDKDSMEWSKIEKVIKDNLPQVLNKKLSACALNSSYNVLLFFDQVNSICEDHADRVYNAVSSFAEKKDILLMIGSKGGEIEPAYLISKNCRSSSKDKFVVCIPRRAKSAATLIALGAAEIHMGAMSELGPIDPQLGQLPALAMNNALDTIATLVSEHPKSSDMFAKYLESQLDLRVLGYFKRINESAKQYAARLLAGKAVGKNFTPESLAQHLVDHYNDHSFVIDNEEALRLFGDEIVRCHSSEYLISSEVEKFTRLISNLCRWLHKKEITFVGSIDDCLKVKDCKKD